MDMEKVIGGLEWVLNDIEENGHYQIDYYADEIRKALAVLKEQENTIENLNETVKNLLQQIIDIKDGKAVALLKECLTDKQKEQKFLVDSDGRKITPLSVVVRCKDCKHYSTKDGECLRNDLIIYFSNGNLFCTDRERRTDDA